jgi:DNA-directed RNA polymerase subunit RPC12/RpoP
MTAPGYRCAHCGQPIDLADTNVATDIALCRACGQTMPFSSLTGSREIATVDLSSPPKGVRVERSLIDGLDVTYHQIPFIVFFLIPFTAMWSGFSLWGIYGSQISKGEFDLADSLAGLPFLIGTLILLSVIAYMLLGHWRITLGRGLCRIFLGIGPVGWTRQIALVPQTTVRLQPGTTKLNNVPQRDIVVTTGPNQLKFGALLPEPVRVFVAAVIERAAQAN